MLPLGAAGGFILSWFAYNRNARIIVIHVRENGSVLTQIMNMNFVLRAVDEISGGS